MRTLTNLALFATSAQAAAITCWAGGPTFDMEYDGSNQSIKITATVPENQWLGIGWGKGMFNIDMVLFQGAGNDGTVTDLWSTANSTP